MLIAAAAGGGDDNKDDAIDRKETFGAIKSMRVQKLTLNRDTAEPRDVWSWFEITVKEINVPSQSFTCSVEIHCFWQDFNLPNVFPEFETEDFIIDEDEVPIKLSEIFENKLDCGADQPVYKYYPDTGTIYMLLVAECVFVERMELQKFPLDRQFLNMAFNAWVTEGNWNWTLEPGLEWVPEDFRDRKFAVRMVSSITEYEMLGPWVDFTGDQPLSIRLRVNRVPSYYFGNIVFPNFLIVAGCFTAFVVPQSDVADRLSVTITLMLAAVAFRFVVSTMLPKVAYLTILDKYLLVGFAALMILIFENAATGAIAQAGTCDEDEITDNSLCELADAIDLIFIFIFGTFWVIVHILATVSVVIPTFYRVTWEEMDAIDQAEDPEDEFVKADPNHIDSQNETDFCKSQWQKHKLKSPASRARIFELEHPEIAEKNRSQVVELEKQRSADLMAAGVDVPSKVVAFADDMDLNDINTMTTGQKSTPVKVKQAIELGNQMQEEESPQYDDNNGDDDAVLVNITDDNN